MILSSQRSRNWEGRGLEELPMLKSLKMVAGFMAEKIQWVRGENWEVGRAWKNLRVLGPTFWPYPLLLAEGQCPGARLPLGKLLFCLPPLLTHLHLRFSLFALRVTFSHCWCLGNHRLRASAMSYLDQIFLRADSVPCSFLTCNLLPLPIQKKKFFFSSAWLPYGFCRGLIIPKGSFLPHTTQ